MKTKLDQFLKYPCLFTYKIIGIAKPTLVDKIVNIVRLHVSGDFSVKIKPSKKGSYHAVSVTITAIHIQQIEILYEELGKIDIVRLIF